MDEREPKSGNRVARAVRCAKLMSRPGGATIRQIMEELGYRTRKSVYDILPLLDEMDIPVQEHKSGKTVVFSVDKNDLMRWAMGQMDMVLDEDDVLMLSFLFESFGRSSAIMSAGGDELVHRLAKALNIGDLGRNRSPGQGAFFAVPPTAYKHLILLLKAAREELSCYVTYNNSDGNEKSYIVWPMKCFIFEGGVYAAVINEHESVMFLALQRIRDIMISVPQRQFPGCDEDIDQLLEDPFCIVRKGERQRYVIRLDAWQGWYEKNKSWPDNVSISVNEDGSYTFIVYTAGRYWLTRWILSLGSSASVIEPEDFKAEIRHELEIMLKNNL